MTGEVKVTKPHNQGSESALGFSFTSRFARKPFPYLIKSFRYGKHPSRNEQQLEVVDVINKKRL